MRATLQHYLNGPHVFCFMRKAGVPKPIAHWIGKRYETLTHCILYRGRK